MLCNFGNKEESSHPWRNSLGSPYEATDEVALILKETMEEAGSAVLKTVPG
jgi:hypothetical protein